MNMDWPGLRTNGTYLERASKRGFPLRFNPLFPRMNKKAFLWTGRDSNPESLRCERSVVAVGPPAQIQTSKRMRFLKSLMSTPNDSTNQTLLQRQHSVILFV